MLLRTILTTLTLIVPLLQAQPTHIQHAFHYAPTSNPVSAETAHSGCERWHDEDAPTGPWVNVKLIPLFLDNNAPHDPTALSVVMSLSAPALASGEKLVILLQSALGHVPSITQRRYDDDAIQASDEGGQLPLSIDDNYPHNQGDRAWRVQRETVGDVHLKFVAYPDNATSHGSALPLLSLRREARTLTGLGSPFLPSLVNPAQMVDMCITWDLTHAPPDVSAVWTWGDGAVSTHRGPAADLQRAFFGVGLIDHWITVMNAADNFGFYCLGCSLDQWNNIAGELESLYVDMTEFFFADSAGYRIFFIQGATASETESKALPGSFVFQFSDHEEIEDWSLYFLLVHEMIHGWPVMQPMNIKDLGQLIWFNEGVADYYRAWIPYRYGRISAAQFLEDINLMTTSYYLSPLRQKPLNLSTGDLWNEHTESTKLQLTRGVMYLMRLSGVIKQASNSTRSIDEAIRALLHASRDGQPYGLKEWQLLLSSEIGESLAREEFTAMKDGKLIIPSSDAFGPCFKLERHDRLMFDIGFETEHGIIRNLDPFSRAALCGLRDGDRIVEESSSFWDLSQTYEHELMLIVEREGSPEVLAFQFWPRGWKEVEAYEWLANPNAPDHCMNQVDDTEPAGWIFD